MPPANPVRPSTPSRRRTADAITGCGRQWDDRRDRNRGTITGKTVTVTGGNGKLGPGGPGNLGLVSGSTAGTGSKVRNRYHAQRVSPSPGR